MSNSPTCKQWVTTLVDIFKVPQETFSCGYSQRHKCHSINYYDPVCSPFASNAKPSGPQVRGHRAYHAKRLAVAYG